MLTAQQFMAVFNASGLLITAVWTPVGGQATAVNGDWRTTFLLGVGEVEDMSPTFEVASDDVPGVAINDLLLIQGVTYKVKGIQPEPNDRGFTNLRLQKQ